MMAENTPIHEGLAEVRRRIDQAARDAGRKRDDIHLVAVTKTFGADVIEPVIVSGQKMFGENRVQEAESKWPGLKASHPALELHLIGPLQSNKAADAVALFDAIHTIDRDKIAAAVSREMLKQARSPSLFVQVNTGLEPQKAGIAPQDVGAFLARCRDEHGLTVTGLMCIPPVDQPPSPHFALLARLARENGLSNLSMGMSGDFEEAIQLGATHVRVGSAIFGGR
ncbi:MAG: YggS family pyridoxal phosphate-dependent enzyme [Rhodobiaceae bacterium]|nr:YggS family pyridoxal phosphate-dependent enzyme [Rhodobiaceae bacterium]MCC0055454.1 YggS family pyridoxal phosphate-dependent enzyme [Rhodobiaceae bacterium]